ncbi:MAG: hypothetical protein DMF56_26935 [Acidobacteria bacterium]|nr:MAG: hypothetical protein DMF56_26935 [Acidobacteriota bacterium]
MPAPRSSQLGPADALDPELQFEQEALQAAVAHALFDGPHDVVPGHGGRRVPCAADRPVAAAAQDVEGRSMEDRSVSQGSVSQGSVSHPPECRSLGMIQSLQSLQSP